MRTVMQIFVELQATSSKNEKVAIIKRNKDNELFRECLKFLLDGSITTGISGKKWDKIRISSDYRMIEPLNGISTVLSYISMNNTGKDEDIRYCKQWAASKTEEEQEFIRGMITKSIKLGCDVKTVSKVLPSLIQVYETQQAYPISDKNAPKNGEWFSLSEKINGTNCGIMNGKCISRQGKPFTNMDHILAEIKTLGLDDYYVNGELVRFNIDNIPDDENFQKSISIINSDLEDKTEIGFIFYEILTMDEFSAGKSQKRYRDRFADYLAIKERIEQLGLRHIKFINHFYAGKDTAEIDKWLEYADSNNMEGLMLNKNTFWENKRNNGILKVKSFKHCDILCKGVFEGEGRLAGKLGGIICDYKGFDLGVGSGFTDVQRDLYWNHPEEIVGRVVQVKYKTETKNKDGGVSVQFPVFQIVREVGKEVSYN